MQSKQYCITFKASTAEAERGDCERKGRERVQSTIHGTSELKTGPMKASRSKSVEMGDGHGERQCATALV